MSTVRRKRKSRSTRAKPQVARASKVRAPDLRRAVALVTELMAIPGKSCEEGAIVAAITRKLRKAGVKPSDIVTDNAHRKTPAPGEVGNLVFKLPGTQRGPRRMLMGHVDTVPLCVGCRPVRKGGTIHARDATTGLGADNRAGASVVLATALEILERKLDHPPLTFCWPVQEEIGLQGARCARVAALGKPRLAFNWDGGAPDKLTVGATGAYRLAITVKGLASHAGGAPEMGVSAIAIASTAIADLVSEGWHGQIIKGSNQGTSNVGFVQGGGATNVVTDHVEIHAEARSHDPRFRRQIVKAIEKAFRQATREIVNAKQKRGRVTIESALDYEAFLLARDDPSVLAAEQATTAVGLSPVRAISNGGLDANWMTAHGIPTVTLGCGQRNQHTVAEELNVADFENACRVALKLATATEAS